MSENQFSILMQQALTFDNRTRKSPDFECPIFGTRKLSHQKNLATTQQKKLKLYNTCFVRVQQPLPVLTFHYYAIFCQLNAFSGPSINKT